MPCNIGLYQLTYSKITYIYDLVNDINTSTKLSYMQSADKYYHIISLYSVSVQIVVKLYVQHVLSMCTCVPSLEHFNSHLEQQCICWLVHIPTTMRWHKLQYLNYMLCYL